MSNDTMKAAIFYGPGNISVREKKIPYDGAALLRVKSCTVCGYDARVFQNGHTKVRPPVTLGHEICGEVVQDLPSIDRGTRVAVYPIMPCLDCKYCFRRLYNLCANRKEVGSSIDGGFAEYIAIPKEILKVGGLIPIPDAISSEEAALIEPLACCLNGFARLGPVGLDHSVAILGDGPIGLIHLQLSRNLFGTNTVVIGKNPRRMKIAQSLGADSVFDAESASIKDILRSNGGSRFDVVVIATNDPAAVDLAFKIADRGSRVSLFGGINNTKLDYSTIHYNEVSVIGSFSSLPQNFREAVKIAHERKIIDLSKMVTHRFSLEQIHQAFSATSGYDGLRVAVNTT